MVKMEKIMRISVIDIVVAGLVLWLSAQAWGDTTSEWDDPSTGELSYVGTGQKVGIGTDTPGAELDVRGGQGGGWNESITTRSSAWPNGRASMGNYSGEGMIRVYDSGNTLNAQISGNNSVGYTYFNAGNVGIGTATPSVSLHNNGDFITKGPWIDVRAFGAVGTDDPSLPGSDDRAAIQAAIDYAIGLTNKPVVYIPAGQYRLSTGLLLTAAGATGLRIFGDGRDSKLYHYGTDNGIEISNVAGVREVYLRGLFITGTSSGNAGIMMVSAHYTKIDDVTIEGYTNTTGGFESEGGAAIKMDNCIVTSIMNSRIVQNRHGIWTRGGGTGVINGLDITNSYFGGNTHRAVSIARARDFLATGNVLESTTPLTSYGIVIDSAGGSVIEGNYFEIDGPSSIETTSGWASSVNIEGNAFEGVADQEIYINGGYSCFIQGNALNSFAPTNAFIRIDASTSNYGVILGNIHKPGLPAYTFLQVDNGTLSQWFVQDPLQPNFKFYNGATGTTVTIDPNSLEVSGTGIKIGSSGTKITNHLSGTTTWDPASIANGAATSTTLTVTGAVVGNTVAVGFSVAVPGRALLVGAVTSANTVTVTLANHTGGSLNLASGTLRADAWQH